jgi:GT2 family glycosyltransferase
MRLFDSAEMVIANFMISREVLDKVGLMDDRFDPYGAIDLDYNKRCNAAGFTNYYLGGVVAHHIHDHDGQELYGYNKSEKVNETWQLHVDGHLGHIPIIEMKQMQDATD